MLLRKLSALIAVALVPSFLCAMEGMDKIVNLPTPDLSDAQVLRYSVGIRPCRKSGIRLEAENIKGKLIVHDYGHGGSGISLSWGCAQEAVNIMKQHAPDHRGPIVIVGAGIIGMTTAHILKDQGYDVIIYSHDFIPCTTSNIAAGVWSPHFGLGAALDEERFSRIKEASYSVFCRLAAQENPEFRGVFFVPTYVDKNKYKITDELPKSYVVAQVNGVFKVCKKKSRLVFDLNIYLQELFDKAKAKGVVFEQRNIQSMSELDALPASIIFNCTGLGSRELFNDTELFPIKGHLVVYKAQPEIDFMISAYHQKRDIFFSLIPWKTQLLLGGTLEEGIEDLAIDQEKIEALRHNAKEFFNL